jgi:hypothetical protein
MLQQTSIVNSLHLNKEKLICLQAVFEVQPPHMPDLNPSDFYLWKLKNPTVFSSKMNIKRNFNAFVTHVKPFTTSPGTVKGCNSS